MMQVDSTSGAVNVSYLKFALTIFIGNQKAIIMSGFEVVHNGGVSRIFERGGVQYLLVP